MADSTGPRILLTRLLFEYLDPTASVGNADEEKKAMDRYHELSRR